ncbi:ATP-binding cassette domain-containing protein, partial [Streptomyces thermolilacinus]|uniref:ATP-binding cassette domain-containing protein n=1 Tax=Streptomyces thermolilacinus TaxID=285540 RepID=UPI0033F158D1
MLQAIGLTSTPRRNRPPAVDDLTFEARPGQVTALLGPTGAGKTTALRLVLGLEQGRGITYFRGRPLPRVAHPMREVGALLGDVPGHPARTVRGQLRMLCAAAGVPASRADDLIDAVGLEALAGQRLGTLSRGMDRRLGVAAALLGDPHTLILDEPAAGLSRHEAAWLYGVLRAHADEGGTVLYATADTKAAARTADHVVAIRSGRLVADQDAADFARTRLRPRVAVRTPHAARLAAQLTREARAARRSVEAVTERGNRLYVYGSDCAEVGETAFRHGIILHRLAEETGPAPDPAPRPRPQDAAPEPLAPAADRVFAPRTTVPAPLSTGPATPDHQVIPEHPAPQHHPTTRDDSAPWDDPATPDHQVIPEHPAPQDHLTIQDDPTTPHDLATPHHPAPPHHPAALDRPTQRAPRWRGRRARRGPSRPQRDEKRRLQG